MLSYEKPVRAARNHFGVYVLASDEAPVHGNDHSLRTAFDGFDLENVAFVEHAADGEGVFEGRLGLASWVWQVSTKSLLSVRTFVDMVSEWTSHADDHANLSLWCSWKHDGNFVREMGYAWCLLPIHERRTCGLRMPLTTMFTDSLVAQR